VSTVLQRLTVALWTEPRAAAVVAAAARTYDERRRLLVTSLADRGVQASGETGLNVWVPVADETAVVTSMARSGWGVAPGARFRQVSAPGVRVTVSGLPTAAIPQLADDLADAVSARAAGGYTT
jgi:aspartate/methionine/tyrosine aminotransferase